MIGAILTFGSGFKSQSGTEIKVEVMSCVTSAPHLITMVNVSLQGRANLWALGQCPGSNALEQTFRNPKWLSGTESGKPFSAILAYSCNVKFLKIYRTEQSFTGHVL